MELALMLHGQVAVRQDVVGGRLEERGRARETAAEPFGNLPELRIAEA